MSIENMCEQLDYGNLPNGRVGVAAARGGPTGGSTTTRVRQLRRSFALEFDLGVEQEVARHFQVTDRRPAGVEAGLVDLKDLFQPGQVVFSGFKPALLRAA